MKVKDMDGCEQCPLLDNLCPGGMTSTPSGSPMEPPCASWDDEEDLDDIHNRAIKSRIAQENYLEEKRKKEEQAKKAREEKTRKAKESRWHVRHEQRQINARKKKIAANENLMSLARAFSTAVNMANESFRHNQRIEPNNTSLEDQNKKLLAEIKELEIVKKQKLKELRDKRKAIGNIHENPELLGEGEA